MKREGEGQAIVTLEQLIGILPEDLDAMLDEARGEGYRMLDRLALEWDAGTTRFNRPGEALFAVYANGDLAGIGGLTVEPAISGALRMRRFYVRRPFRGCAIARRLALALLDRPETSGRPITVNAAASSEPFWESLGFVPDRHAGHTHILPAEASRR